MRGKNFFFSLSKLGANCWGRLQRVKKNMKQMWSKNRKCNFWTAKESQETLWESWESAVSKKKKKKKENIFMHIHILIAQFWYDYMYVSDFFFKFPDGETITQVRRRRRGRQLLSQLFRQLFFLSFLFS